MIYLKNHITSVVLDFILENQDSFLNYLEINIIIKEISGINNFFDTQEEVTRLLTEIRTDSCIISSLDRREYGDFQTNSTLASQVVEYISKKNEKIEFVLEPTCGKGNFLLACILQFKQLKKIVGVEIYKPYIWYTKFRLLDYYLKNPNCLKPEIDIIHGNAFEFDYNTLANSTRYLTTLVIGNPPWITNSELGLLESENLPRKSNFKKYTGVDAMTGKGNFDISEYISYILLKCFEGHDGVFAFLIKNSVAKNLIHDQKINHFRIGYLEKLLIDSKKEFNVSVNACLFFAYLNAEPNQTCMALDFYTRKLNAKFGWYQDKFVNSIDDYKKSSVVDGKSIFVWRSGVKHDCAKVMELKQENGYFLNGLGEEVELETDLVYGLLKSSDLKVIKTSIFRKLTIITQSKVGQDTGYIQEKYPLTYAYLHHHKAFFEKRKSSIYKSKPYFSIFGIGNYSFANYKVAISGLYKSTHFTLISPNNNKPIMLDDTCYFIGFENMKMAQVAHFLVNSDLVQRFLKSIIFFDSKRSINKDILMRIDFHKVFENADFEVAKQKIDDLKRKHWNAFEKMIKEN